MKKRDFSIKRNLIFLLVAIFSTTVFAHDMSIAVKKEKFIESLLDSYSFPSALKSPWYLLEEGELIINTPEAIKHPFLLYYTPAWMDEGDQDVEEFHFYFSSQEGNFYLNCNILTTVISPVLKNQPTINKMESLGCVLHNQDNKSKKTVNLNRRTWNTY